MPLELISDTVVSQIDALVEHYKKQQRLFYMTVENLRTAFDGSSELSELIHSHKFRIKDPEHLRDKLNRNAIKAASEGRSFDITPQNLAQKINDLAGFRLIHLHTQQFKVINKTLLSILEFNNYPVIEGPWANAWDDEARNYFVELGVEVRPSKRMYTSVHYVIGSNSKSQVTCELQVRTLSEEIWGEVDHKINYPHPHDDLSCREQIKVLARVTSSCSRLVSSIFATHDDRQLFLAKGPGTRKGDQLIAAAEMKRESKPRKRSGIARKKGKR